MVELVEHNSLWETLALFIKTNKKQSVETTKLLRISFGLKTYLAETRQSIPKIFSSFA